MNRTFISSLAAALLLVCTIVTAQASAPDPRSSAVLEQEAARLVNRERTARGLPPYMQDHGLGVKARIKSRDLAQGGYWDHTSPTYGSPFAMMRTLGISYTSAGENIAKGYSSPGAVVHAWMNSPSHRANLLSRTYTTMGIGHHDGYWTQWLIR